MGTLMGIIFSLQICVKYEVAPVKKSLGPPVVERNVWLSVSVVLCLW